MNGQSGALLAVEMLDQPLADRDRLANIENVSSSVCQAIATSAVGNAVQRVEFECRVLFEGWNNVGDLHIENPSLLPGWL